MLGLFRTPPLVACEIGVELRQAHHLEARLVERAVEDAGVVRRQQVQAAVGLAGRMEAGRGGDGSGIALELAVHAAQARLRRHQRQPCAQRECKVTGVNGLDLRCRITASPPTTASAQAVARSSR